MADRETTDGKEAVDSTKSSERTRTGTPRKSKAKEIIVDEEFCVFCYGTCTCNDDGDFEELLRCSECLKYAHPSCLEMPYVAVERTKVYPWQCNDCKECFHCKKKNKEKSMVLCDFCDRGFHTFCLERKPTRSQRSSWKCPFCVESESALGCSSPEKGPEIDDKEQYKKETKTQQNDVEKQTSTKEPQEDRTAAQKIENESRKDRKEVQKSAKTREKGKGAKEHKKEVVDISDDEIAFSVSEIKKTTEFIVRVDKGSEGARKVKGTEDTETRREIACKESKTMESNETEESNKSVSSLESKKKVFGKESQKEDTSKESENGVSSKESEKGLSNKESGKGLSSKDSEKDLSSKESEKGLSSKESGKGASTKESEKGLSSKDAIPKENENAANQDSTIDKTTPAESPPCQETKKESCLEVKLCSVELGSDLDIKAVESDERQGNKKHNPAKGWKTNTESAFKLDTETGKKDDIPDNKVHSTARERRFNLKSASKQDIVTEKNGKFHDGSKEHSPARGKKTRTESQKRRHSTRLGIRPVETLNDVSGSDQGKCQTKDVAVTDVKPREEASTVVKPASVSQRRRSSRFSLPVVDIESGIKLKELEKVKEEIAALVGEKEKGSSCDKSNDGNVQSIKRKRGRPPKVPLKVDSSASDEEKESEDGKNQNESNEKEANQEPSKEPAESTSSENEREAQRVLRKTSREPAITPTTARSILAAETFQRIYPIRKTDPDKGTPLKKTPLKKLEKTPLKTPNRKTSSSTKGTPKSVTLKAPKTVTPKTPKSDKTVSGSKKSGTPKSDARSSVTRKSDKATDVKSASKSGPLKRRLSYDENSSDSKKSRKLSLDKPIAKITKQVEPEASRISKRQSKGKRRNEDVEATKSPSDEDLENVVSLADIALFEQAQEMLRTEKENAGENIVEQGIKKVDFGEYEIDTWYSSPYPSEYKTLGKVFVCEYCLKYMKSATILRRHMAKCLWRHPPGDEIYRKDTISVFEVDGAKSAAYCQNLCLFAKLFLDHKTLYYEVEPFLFYVMAVADCSGCHIAGYFSKEKTSFLNYNVSCILVLPHYMRKGYGKILIGFSYLLSRTEGKIGSPERPLSDLGLISYRSYWKDVLLRYLTALPDDHVSIKEMSQKTSVLSNDLISTMQFLGILKYWKGKHVITLQQELLDAYATKRKARGKLKLDVDEDCLEWTPKDYGQGKSRSKNS